MCHGRMIALFSCEDELTWKPEDGVPCIYWCEISYCVLDSKPLWNASKEQNKPMSEKLSMPISS